jgi:hypothetical protein
MDDILLSVLSLETINLSDEEINEFNDAELLDACKKVFDCALDAPANNTAIAALVDNVGPVKLMNLADRIEYSRKVELRTAILEVTLHQFVATTTAHVDVLFGCRKPGTAPGAWTGAYVVAQEGARFVAALFENDVVDYFGYEATMQDAISQYEEFVSEGWQPMTADDLSMTTDHQDALHVVSMPDGEPKSDVGSKKKEFQSAAPKKLAQSCPATLELDRSSMPSSSSTNSTNKKLHRYCCYCCW